MNKTDKGYIGMGMEGPIASWYAKITAKDNHRHQALAQKLARELPAGSRVLEVAPGPGYFCVELAKLGDFEITGLDISKSFVEIAHQNAAAAGARVDFRQGNASEMPFEDNRFDLIVCQAAFKNFSQPVQAIAEMYRVLRPNGRALIIDLSRDVSEGAIDREVGGMRLNPVNRFITRWTFRNMLLKRAYSTEDMAGMVAQTPFHTCEIQESGVGFQVTMKKGGA
jgi:ubiquinone/menaquinone biosynthesis C-methylase UbiE